MSQDIQTLNGIVHITVSLHVALRKLRRNFKDYIVVWADTICINQSNIREKGRQVQLMPQIYQNAKEVTAFLGEDEEDSQLAVDLILKLGEKTFNSESGRPTSLKSLDHYDIPSIEDKCWSALQLFVRRPWFRRAWIIQECILDRNVESYCGNWTMPFEILILPVLKLYELNLPTF